MSAPEIYQSTEPYYVQKQRPVENPGTQIERGRPIAVLDYLNHYLISLPTKLILLDWRVLDHRITDEGLLALQRYLAMNQLLSVKVRHNQYAPLAEWSRLRKNQEVGPFYRYTLGVVAWLQYTLIPDRLFAGLPLIGGGDHFNPFTNTIHVYSSDVAVLLHEAGHAKDYVRHESKGTSFVLPRLVPGVDLLQEAVASADAIRFLQCVRDEQNELHAYGILIPAYSTYIAGYFQGGLVVTLPIVATGHVSGRIQSWQRARAIEREKEDRLPGFHRSDFLPDYCQPLQANSHAGRQEEGAVDALPENPLRNAKEDLP